jgi:hypothetical protein
MSRRVPLDNDTHYVTFTEARALADDLRDGAVQVGALWDRRKARVLELHQVCRGLIDERERVATRLGRHSRILKSLLATSSIHEAIVTAVQADLPGVTRANIEQRLSALIAASLLAMGEVRLVNSGAR